MPCVDECIVGYVQRDSERKCELAPAITESHDSQCTHRQSCLRLKDHDLSRFLMCEKI